MSHLTVAYLTSRKEPKLEWFTRSLLREAGNDIDIGVVVIDFHLWDQTFSDDYRATMRKAEFVNLEGCDWRSHFGKGQDNRQRKFADCGVYFKHSPPKPTVWQYPFRLTQHDYFAAANARNTAICYAKDGWIAFVDDLSVLMPGWLNAVREAMAKNYIVCGAFRKVNKLVVENGEVKSFEDHPSGHDSRWAHGDDTKAVPCHPNWLFGCSLAAPVNAFLKINGWPEDCDSSGIGMEDCMTGLALANTCHKLKYDRRMFTLESEELHHVDTPMLRKDKDRGRVIEVSPGVTHPAEKGHALVKRLSGKKWFENDFGSFPDLAALRQHVLAGSSFPIVNRPTVDWYDNQPLSEM